jgi:hypothetical protein
MNKDKNDKNDHKNTAQKTNDWLSFLFMISIGILLLASNKLLFKY